jgi:hypothetical protein
MKNPKQKKIHPKEPEQVNITSVLFFKQLQHYEIPLPEREFRFHEKRQWRFDYCWQAQLLALEVEGGVWKYGRHNRPTGFIRDMKKYNEAAAKGYRVIRELPANILKKEFLLFLKTFFISETDSIHGKDESIS